MLKKFSDEDVVSAYYAANESIVQAGKMLGLTERRMHTRLAAVEAKTGVKIRLGKGSRVHVRRDTRPNPIEMRDGTIFVASDCHYWPGHVSPAHRAFVHLLKKVGADAVVVNGDEFDGASISRHGRTGWEQRPTVAQEITEVQERLREIKRASPGAHHLGTYGNHTLRLDTYLSAHASAMEGVYGMKYDDMVPGWTYAWAWMVNGHTLIKHRHKNGTHAGWTSTGDAQINTVTGHLHQLKVTPRSTMSPINNGRIFGVDTGMLADPWGPQFSYVEQGPRNWAAGFAVLTFEDGFLRPPELCEVIEEDAVWFRGNRIEV